MANDSNNQVNILLSLDTNRTFVESYKASRWQAEDAQSIMSTWEIKPNRQDKRNSTGGPPSHASRGPATAAVDTPAPSAKPLQQQLP